MNKKFIIKRIVPTGELYYRCCCNYGETENCKYGPPTHHNSPFNNKGSYDKVTLDTFYHKWPSFSKATENIIFELES